MRRLRFALPLLFPLLLVACHPDPRPISYGQTQPGFLHTLGDTDRLTFTPAAGDLVLVRARESASSAALDLRLVLRKGGETGTKICEAFTFGAFVELKDQCPPLENVQHTIVVDDVGADETGDYNLHLQRRKNPASATAISFEQTTMGRIDPAVETNAFTFTAPSGAVVRVLVIERTDSPALDPEVRIFNTVGSKALNENGVDGVPCDQRSFGTTVDIECGPLAPGQHTILVMDIDGEDTGNYDILLQQLT